MLFDSPEYFYFFTVALLLYWSLRERGAARTVVVFGLSCIFYMAASPKFIVLMLGSTFLDSIVGRKIAAATDQSTKKRWLVLSIGANLLLLGTFKYWNFVATSTEDVAQLLGNPIDHPLLRIALPPGISFYTFESMSYVIDVYRGKHPPAKRFLDLAFFISFFPKLVMGPIVRPGELLPQLERRPGVTRDGISRGLFLIGMGLIKKLVFSDYVSANFVDRVFTSPDRYSGTEVVIALYAFTLQIYCDFSGYTDVARGSAMLLGIELPENFDRPYQATNIADFWRRWHMTLSTWLRDYLYYPLGGSKVGGGRAYFNLFITMFLIGLWHRASWTFVVYGALQGTAMCVHRYMVRRSGKRAADYIEPTHVRVLKIVGMLQFVVFSRILFRADGMGNAGEIVERIVSGTSSMAQITPALWTVIILGFAMHYTPRSLIRGIEARFMAMPPVAQGLVLATAACLVSLIDRTGSTPYIYFQF